ncbi:aldose epimerase family protein [Cellulomonas fengjieae]|uniref:Aldose epimerase n=1 Tax=Cellulomonas fengjieae TaxID=2819978 RepID=A0ABS3SLD3_9CELL|nr:aldose epimerase [Cellulomonas fengjieae]MBO3086179.1 aldose epimerase [Cellulomonas fengjieae]MBO3102416.1 aldose epimerase [Cellulomonas fengjieae]QVI65762.1 aldose epimerase [Cellulomonas fengjieae]
MTTLQERMPTAVAGADPRVVTLRSDRWELDVLPETGAAIAAGRVRTPDGVWRDLLRPTRSAGMGEPEKCASFPMIPWSNRVSAGVLRFGGRSWQLQRNCADGTAIHGAARHSPWSVVERTDGRVVLELDTCELVGVNFPWKYRARITYALSGDRLTVGTSLRNTDVEPFPGGFGHHPYLQRSLSPVGSPGPAPRAHPVLEVPAHKSYAMVRALPSGPAGAVSPRADFRVPRPLTSAFVDDVVTGWEPGAPVRIHYPDSGVGVDLHADPVFAHLVLYAPRKRSYFAVEPVTNVNDGFTMHEQGVPGTGVFVLEPGEERSGAFTMTVRT